MRILLFLNLFIEKYDSIFSESSVFAFATLTFVVPLSQGSLISAFFYGAALGLVIYGVYDFTCVAIFKDWPVMMAFVDWLWGTILCAISATITVYISRLMDY